MDSPVCPPAPGVGGPDPGYAPFGNRARVARGLPESSAPFAPHSIPLSRPYTGRPLCASPPFSVRYSTSVPYLLLVLERISHCSTAVQRYWVNLGLRGVDRPAVHAPSLEPVGGFYLCILAFVRSLISRITFQIPLVYRNFWDAETNAKI